VDTNVDTSVKSNGAFANLIVISSLPRYTYITIGSRQISVRPVKGAVELVSYSVLDRITFAGAIRTIPTAGGAA
jgi:hypothetical protein